MPPPPATRKGPPPSPGAQVDVRASTMAAQGLGGPPSDQPQSPSMPRSVQARAKTEAAAPIGGPSRPAPSPKRVQSRVKTEAASRFDSPEMVFDAGDIGEINLELESTADDVQTRPNLFGPGVGGGSVGNSSMPSMALANSGEQGGNLSPRSMAEGQEMDVKRLAGFGEPEGGVIGTIKYGLRVRSRLAPLKEETAKAKQDKDGAWENLEIAKAQLGRQAHKGGVREESLDKLMRKAVEVDGKLHEIKRQNDKLDEDFNQKAGRLDSAIKGVEQEMEPFKVEEIRAQAEYDRVSGDRKRTMAKIKRSEIELRNLKELIEKRQAEYADLERPKEERARLLKEIAQFDKRQILVVERMEKEQAEMETLTAPFEKAKGDLDAVRGKLAAKNEIIGGFRKQREEVVKETELMRESIRGKAQGESEQAQKAWAQVGERVFLNKLFVTEALKVVAKEVQQKSQVFFAAQAKLDLHERALTSFDYDVYAMSKKYMLYGAIACGVIVVAILVSVAL